MTPVGLRKQVFAEVVLLLELFNIVSHHSPKPYSVS